MAVVNCISYVWESLYHMAALPGMLPWAAAYEEYLSKPDLKTLIRKLGAAPVASATPESLRDPSNPGDPRSLRSARRTFPGLSMSNSLQTRLDRHEHITNQQLWSKHIWDVLDNVKKKITNPNVDGRITEADVPDLTEADQAAIANGARLGFHSTQRCFDHVETFLKRAAVSTELPPVRPA